jgi:Fe-S cluster biosynthesis and repair protein YggX
MIRYNYEKFGYSMTELSKIFKVDRRLIQFELYPERKLQNIQKRMERGGWSQYYDKDTHSISMKNHRNNKDEINKQFNLI